MYKKLIFLLLFLNCALFGYTLGDTLDKSTIDKLGIKDDKIYIVDFYASWCVSCKVELPLISKLNSTIEKTKYMIIGINIDKDINKGKAFTKKADLRFKIIYDNKNKLVSKFDPIGVPALYYIKNYKVEKVLFGAIEHIDKKILNDLKGMEQR
ncbi:MAG: TlpA disulfide reductase family protein [Campylobacterota bacterium]|nr:TlpA disulfide reductase family protein [Campylobacterota bacterium]